MTCKLNDNFLDRLEKNYGPIARNLSMTLRPTFCAKTDDKVMMWGDWAAIEARILPWLTDSSGGDKVLNVFKLCDKDPFAPDNYMIAAAPVFRVTAEDINERLRNSDKNAKFQRQVGKVIVLALGFGGGIGALIAMATAYGIHFEESEAQRIVNIWRDENKWAKNFWSCLTKAFENTRRNPGQAFTVGRLTYVYDPDYHGGTVFCVLPCGRALSYPHVKVRKIKKIDKKTGDEFMKEALTYRKNYSYGALWHGILAENPTQAVAASILRGTLKRLETERETFINEGYEPLFETVGHTHDEIIGEVFEDEIESAESYLKSVMEKPFEWADGLPLVAEISNHWFYTKTKG